MISCNINVERRASVALASTLCALLVVLSPGSAFASAEMDNGRMFAPLGQGLWGPDATPRAPRVEAVPGEARTPTRPGRRLASLGRDGAAVERPSLTGAGRIVWHAPSSCLNGRLAAVVAEVAASFAPVRVSSTCRSRGHNSRVGGAPRSKHLTGNAVDFRVFGNVAAVRAFLRGHASVGGLKHYGGGLFHIDTGARRPM